MLVEELHVMVDVLVKHLDLRKEYLDLIVEKVNLSSNVGLVQSVHVVTYHQFADHVLGLH